MEQFPVQKHTRAILFFKGLVEKTSLNDILSYTENLYPSDYGLFKYILCSLYDQPRTAMSFLAQVTNPRELEGEQAKCLLAAIYLNDIALLLIFTTIKSSHTCDLTSFKLLLDFLNFGV